MLLGITTLLVALTLSAVAAYYSVLGLTAIFAAAFWPVIIMGGTLEVGKIMATVWLHRNWTRSPLPYKLYLVPAVAFLMLLTSMGIYGFLSKAHIEQTNANIENAAQIEKYDKEILRNNEIVRRAEEKIRQLESTGTGVDAQVQAQIDREQSRIDAAYKRLEPAIQDQNNILNSQLKIYTDQISKIDADLAQIQTNLDAGKIDVVQKTVGLAPDGRFGPRTSQAINEFKERQAQRRAELVRQVEQISNNPTVRAARAELQRLRSSVDSQVAESNNLINRLRQQIGKGNTANVDQLVNEQQQKIREANDLIEQSTKEKYRLESDFRQLEAEVGPVKYIAELVYGQQADKELLEKAVRWVIILIVIVFDPLALVLILAATKQIEWSKLERAAQPRPQSTDTTSQPIEEPKAEEPQRSFLEQHPYLTKPWVHFPSGLPIYVWPQPKKQVPNSETESQPLEASNVEVSADTISVDSASQETVSNIADTSITTGVAETKDPPPKSIVQPKEAEERKGSKVLSQLVADNDDSTAKPVRAHFGTTFPADPSKGDLYLRVDFLPSKLYKHNGSKWMEIDKSLTDSYIFNEEYIKYMIKEIESGNYNLEDLSQTEQEQIKEFLRNEHTDNTPRPT